MADNMNEDQVIDEGQHNEDNNDADLDNYTDEDLSRMRARVAEMEAEAETLRQMQAGLDHASGGTAPASPKPAKEGEGETKEGEPTEDSADVDARSIYVGNVDYGASPEEVQTHFHSCGTINRVTILCDKWTQAPKGYAYVEFASPDLVQNALALNESLFRGRQLSVVAKRTNIPGFNRGRGRGRGAYRGGYQPRGGYNPYARGRGGPRGRGRGRGAWAPY